MSSFFLTFVVTLAFLRMLNLLVTVSGFLRLGLHILLFCGRAVCKFVDLLVLGCGRGLRCFVLIGDV